jgi:transposase
MGWTPQRPVTQLRDPNDAEITQWVSEEFPRILKRARRRHAYLVFVDESGFMLAPVLRRSYAPRGKPPCIKTSDPHGRISAIGAMTISPERRNFGFQFHLLADNANFNGHSVVRFVNHLRCEIRNPITLFWDQILIHRAKVVNDYLARYRRLVVEPFPPLASQLNPVDKVWWYVKYDRLPNFAPVDLTELRDRVTMEFSNLQKRPGILEFLFRRTPLSLDREHS